MLAALLLTTASGAALATEGGGSLRPFGVDTVMSGVMAGPGTRLNTFVGYYEADQTNDSAGNARPGISDFRLRAAAVTFRLAHVWDGVEWLGANVESRIVLPLVDVSVGLNVPTPGGPVRREGSARGLGDMALAPVILGWHSPAYHQMAGIFAYLPTGDFDATHLTNPGRGYFGWAPVYWFTWFPAPEIEVSGTASYLFNSTNSDTRYKSGDEAGLDFGLGYAFVRDWQLGVSGYLYQQVTDDKVNGNVVGDGNQGEVIAIGPFIRYSPSRDWGVTLKWQYETQAENRPQGNRFIPQFMFKLP